MGWKRIGLMRRPAAGGEARERASFLFHDWSHSTVTNTILDCVFIIISLSVISNKTTFISCKEYAMNKSTLFQPVGGVILFGMQPLKRTQRKYRKIF